jgi:hypothetical protein
VVQHLLPAERLALDADGRGFDLGLQRFFFRRFLPLVPDLLVQLLEGALAPALVREHRR